MKANECYGTTVADVEADTILLSLNQRYGSASDKDADVVYAQVQEGIEDEYEYVISQ